MGLFGFIGDVASAAVKVAVTPVTVLQDTVEVLTGEDADNTSKLIKSAGKDLESSLDELAGEV